MKPFTSFVCLAMAVAGCKGDTVYKDTQQTLDNLDKCKKEKDDLEGYKKKLEAENADLLQKGSGAAGEVVVTIEGDLVKPIHGGFGSGGGQQNGGPVVPADPKAALAFKNVVESSRGAIQKCYEQVLKKNAGLQSKTVTLTVNASFTAAGAYHAASFSPSLGDVFDNCMQAIATRWTVPTNSPSMTFRAQVSLTPS